MNMKLAVPIPADAVFMVGYEPRPDGVDYRHREYRQRIIKAIHHDHPHAYLHVFEGAHLPDGTSGAEVIKKWFTEHDGSHQQILTNRRPVNLVEIVKEAKKKSLKRHKLQASQVCWACDEGQVSQIRWLWLLATGTWLPKERFITYPFSQTDQGFARRQNWRKIVIQLIAYILPSVAHHLRRKSLANHAKLDYRDFRGEPGGWEK